MGARVAVRRSRAARLSRGLGALALPVLVLGALGHRSGVVQTDALLAVLILGFAIATAALAAGVYALVDIWHSGAEGAGRAFAGLIYVAPVIVLLSLSLYAVFAYPNLNDVSTDPGMLPEFQSVGPHPARYAPDVAAALQQDFYPDVVARLYPLSAERVYQAARRLVEQRGWGITLDIPPEAGDALIEATARTPIFAFTDDLMILIATTPEGARVDMRSASRFGDHDLGQNARRIRAFLDDLDGALQGVLELESPEAPAEPDHGEASGPSEGEAAQPEAAL